MEESMREFSCVFVWNLSLVSFSKILQGNNSKKLKTLESYFKCIFGFGNK